MARPRPLAEDRFTTREMAIVAQLTPRNFALLVDEGLAPVALEESLGQSGHRTYDSAALTHCALIGSIHLAGMELLVAARLAAAMADAYGASYGRLPSNLASLLRSSLNPTPGCFPWGKSLPHIDTDNDYWLHERLRFHTGIYNPRTALRGDLLIDIADQAYVLTRHLDSNVKMFSPVSDPLTTSPEYRIVGRGRASRVVPIHEELPSLDFSRDKASADALRELQVEYQSAYDNAETRLCINVSLGVRNGLDRLADARASRTAIAA